MADEFQVDEFWAAWNSADRQLSTVDIMLIRLCPQSGPGAAAAFAGSTAPPQVLLPWLSALCQSLVGASRVTIPGGWAGGVGQ